jgi:hypothetical protein
VIEAVAEAKGVSPNDLPPLYEAIDPDGLDMLFPATTDESGESRECQLEFVYAEQRVTIKSGGAIRIQEIESDVSSPTSNASS